MNSTNPVVANAVAAMVQGACAVNHRDELGKTPKGVPIFVRGEDGNWTVYAGAFESHASSHLQAMKIVEALEKGVYGNSNVAANAVAANATQKPSLEREVKDFENDCRACIARINVLAPLLVRLPLTYSRLAYDKRIESAFDAMQDRFWELVNAFEKSAR